MIGVDLDVVELDGLLISAGKRHPHLDQEGALPIDPQVEPFQALLHLFAPGTHLDEVGVWNGWIRPGADLEQPAQPVETRVREVAIDLLLDVGDVDLLAFAPAGPLHDERRTLDGERLDVGIGVGHDHTCRALRDDRAVRDQRLDQETRDRRLREARAYGPQRLLSDDAALVNPGEQILGGHSRGARPGAGKPQSDDREG